MQSLRILAAAGALALVASGGAFAQSAYHAQARLVAPVAAPTKTVVNGLTWACEGDACTGEAEHYSTLDNPVRACKRVAGALGALASYNAGGRELGGGDLKVCNTAAAAKAGGGTANAKQ